MEPPFIGDTKAVLRAAIVMNEPLSQMALGPGTLIYSGACEWRSHPGIVDNCCKLWICPSHLLIILERAAVTIRDSCRAPSSGATTHTNDFRGCYFAEQFLPGVR